MEKRTNSTVNNKIQITITDETIKSELSEEESLSQATKKSRIADNYGIGNEFTDSITS